MPIVNPSPIGVKLQVELADGTPRIGGQLFTYVAGSVNTKTNTYTDSTGTVANTNPIVLNSLGQPTTEIWIPAGVSVKHVLAPSTDTDPPTSPVWSVDNLRGINDTSVTIDQWVAGPAPTFIGATQFSLVGDQTSTFHVGRRIKATVTAGTVYGRISVSAFAAVTTVTVVLDSGALDSGLSAVSYGLISATSTSVPAIFNAGAGIGITYNANGQPTFAASSLVDTGLCEFRLTLTAGSAVPTGDVATATTIYCAPYKGSRIALYDGANWNIRSSAEFSLALGTLTGSLPYDVFCYDNAGVPTLEFLAWTSTTARATSLALQDGVYVRSGSATRRYMGTFYTISTTQTADSKTAGRYLWNYYNRVSRPMLTTYSADRTLASATYAEPNNEIRANFVIGLSEEPVGATLAGSVTSNAAENRGVAVAFDSATAAAAGFESAMQNLAGAASNIAVNGWAQGLAVGLHYGTLIAKSPAGTLTFSTATSGTVAKAYLGLDIKA